MEKVSGSGLQLNSRYSGLGNEGLIAILAKALSSSPMIAILTSSDHHGSNFNLATMVKYFEEKDTVFGIKLSPLSLLFQQPRYHRNNTDKQL